VAKGAKLIDHIHPDEDFVLDDEDDGLGNMHGDQILLGQSLRLLERRTLNAVPHPSVPPLSPLRENARPNGIAKSRYRESKVC